MELILKHPEKPEAYLSLWHKIRKNKKSEFHCHEIAERLYLSCNPSA